LNRRSLHGKESVEIFKGSEKIFPGSQRMEKKMRQDTLTRCGPTVRHTRVCRFRMERFDGYLPSTFRKRSSLFFSLSTAAARSRDVAGTLGALLLLTSVMAPVGQAVAQSPQPMHFPGSTAAQSSFIPIAPTGHLSSAHNRQALHALLSTVAWNPLVAKPSAR